MRNPITLFALLALALLAAPARAGDTPPPWEQLDAAQREALIAPVRDRWNDQPEAREHMLRHAGRWQRMTPEERRSAHRGMQRWKHMSPERQEQTRILFRHLRTLPEDERGALRERWNAMTPEQRQQWLREHRPEE
ncbi:DUF3106 domain-containing protein [Luteimonas sp. RD2P54]|uniref:DUF3106 domain-containing protein n=1 Tax=Luteimonas endophytica TaxID=3042023 RepID=A0ABT6J5N8_9GAMM|nr:DUF3106 domain-containing protein [Luteimonas endophytica]MDH5822149.1 DUF3106 domain-containing protein [Luteimonas endophytica]